VPSWAGNGGTEAGGSGIGGGGSGASTGGGVPNEAPLLVHAGQYRLASGPYWHALVLSYYQSDPATRCYWQAVDNCTILDCRSSVYGPEAASWASVGPVTYLDGVDPSILLVPADSGAYPEVIGYSTRWVPGQAIEISAPGDELPGFDVVLTMPPPADMLVPDIEHAADGEIQISHAQAFSFTWTPIDTSVMVEVYEGLTDDAFNPDFLSVICHFPGQGGSGQIPAEVMGHFEGGLEMSGLNLGTEQVLEAPLGARTLSAQAANVSWRRIVIL
jgi:hypothetical protein